MTATSTKTEQGSPSRTLPLGVTVTDEVVNQAAAALLAQKYEYTPKHLARIQRVNTRVWKQTCQEVRIALGAALVTGEVPVYDQTAVLLERAQHPNTNIEQFQGPYRFLSNFWPYDGEDVSSTAEHQYQSMKTLDALERAQIMAAETPHAAKLLGDVCTVRSDWEDLKVSFMESIVLEKFNRPALRDQLLSTGSAMLIEGNHWCDTFWGCCSCEEHQGAGKNWLGILLMETRNNLFTHHKELEP